MDQLDSHDRKARNGSDARAASKPRAGNAAATPATVFRWDLDKTYLVSHFESLRYLIRVPFEKAQDKVAVPGVTVLIKALHRTLIEKGQRPLLYFLSASPPQIGSVIEQKLRLDGIVYEGITFKHQVHHLVRGRFDVLREQIGYKLTELLRHRLAGEDGASELLFGDDWESDPFVYSLYADILGGRLDATTVAGLLEQAGVHRRFVQGISSLMRSGVPQRVVRGIFILRHRRVSPTELDAFGRRLVWFDNYFECALRLHAAGFLDARGVVNVASAVGLDRERLARCFESMCSRAGMPREVLGQARRGLLASKIMARVPPGRPLRRALAAWRRRRGRPLFPLAQPVPLPDYRSLVAGWSRRGRKE